MNVIWKGWEVHYFIKNILQFCLFSLTKKTKKGFILYQEDKIQKLKQKKHTNPPIKFEQKKMTAISVVNVVSFKMLVTSLSIQSPTDQAVDPVGFYVLCLSVRVSRKNLGKEKKQAEGGALRPDRGATMVASEICDTGLNTHITLWYGFIILTKHNSNLTCSAGHTSFWMEVFL